MKLIDVHQLSLMLCVKPKTIYYWVSKNQIPYRKLGRLVRFDLVDIDAWVDGTKHLPTKSNRL